MKKIVIISSLTLTLFASDGYVPLSNLSDKQKEEYNFIDKNNVINLEENNSYEKVEKVQAFEEKKELKKEPTKTDEEFIEDYKKQNILKDEKKESSTFFSQDFSITPKLSYSYLTVDGYYPHKVRPEDRKNIIIPELLIRYKNHILKYEQIKVKTYFEKVIIGDNDFDMKTSWQKLAYLYQYNENVNFGLAYNIYKSDSNVYYNTLTIPYEEREKFASLEVNFKNQENNLLAEYGISYGKNHEIDYSYEYYLTLGYKLLDNDKLIFNAGYKNKTISIEDLKFKYEGPVIGISSTF
ncbi:hypothetical protein [Arcobacter aquimarinus]|uniref:Uncharacterized protein n=1 Tax=Arcobacter aquimarinus TaxID=1315211 RepID=A0AAE7B4Z2_9BACT|nr:hypothetical protein [Arcobacter aquimarinus]QKE25849.1 hypothetical protein AAQM_1093 [Arcobacter aquimarinus]RXI35647.1 hypothetical protein CP986_06000 [Arcobacter aquimarinus]